MWSEGTIGVPAGKDKYIAVHYWVKHFDEACEEFGIDGGKISKLSLKQDGAWVANYDRGWDMEPATEAAKAAYAILLHEYN